MNTQEQHRKNVEMLHKVASSTQWRASAQPTAHLWGVTLWKVPGQEGRKADR